jgi:ribonuclease HI
MKPDVVIFCDGGCTDNPGTIAVAAVVCSTDGEVVVESARMAGKGTNNVAEYRALRHAIHLANLVGAKRPMFFSDSNLVVQQVNRLWAMKAGGDLAEAHRQCVDALYSFDRWMIKHVPREQNKRADWLACNQLGHTRTLKNKPKISMVELEGDGRPGWSELPAG